MHRSHETILYVFLNYAQFFKVNVGDNIRLGKLCWRLDKDSDEDSFKMWLTKSLFWWLFPCKNRFSKMSQTAYEICHQHRCSP